MVMFSPSCSQSVSQEPGQTVWSLCPRAGAASLRGFRSCNPAPVTENHQCDLSGGTQSLTSPTLINRLHSLDSIYFMGKV